MQKVVKEYNQHSDAGEKLGWTVWSHTIVLQRRRGAEVGAQLVHCICRHAVLMLDWRCWMTSPFPHVVSSRCMHTRNTHICTGVHLLYLLAYLLCQEGDFTFSSSRLTSFCVSLYLTHVGWCHFGLFCPLVKPRFFSCIEMVMDEHIQIRIRWLS